MKSILNNILHGRFSLFTFLLLISFTINHIAHAQSGGGSGGCTNKYTISATDSATNLTHSLIGEKGLSTSACEFVNGSFFGDSACTSEYMFTDYVGDTAYINATLSDGITSLSNGNYRYHVWLNDSLIGPISGIVAAHVDGAQIIFSMPGIYKIIIDEVYPYLTTDDFEFYFVIIPKITAVTILPTPICNTWSPPLSDNLYHFMIKTTPDITAIMDTTDLMYVPITIATGACGTPIPAINIQLNVIDTSLDSSVSYGYYIQGNADFNVSYGIGHPFTVDNTYESNFWGSSIYTPSNMYSFSIQYQDTTHSGVYSLSDFLINPTTDTQGIYYGRPSMLKVYLTDGVGITPAAPLIGTAPIVINAPQTITGIDINTRCAPGSPGATAPYPQYSVSVAGGSSPYSYLWSYISDCTEILDNDTISNPSIIFNTVSPHHLADYILTVTDNIGCIVKQHVRTPLITSGWDLASRDSYFDMYDEPNDQLAVTGNWNVWQSPDIWNRYHDDTGTVHEPPEYAATGDSLNYLNVKVRNVGCIDYPSSWGASLNTYWTIGGGPETWNSYWLNNSYGGHTFPACSGSPTQGTQINGPFIPDISAGSSTIMTTSWVPPNPYVYYPSSCSSLPTYLELCFLSRIVDYHHVTYCDVDGMTICETDTGTIAQNVWNNNNIATHNTSIAFVHALNSPPHHIVMFGNGNINPSTFSIQFVNNFALQPSTGISTLSNYVNVKVFLGPLFDIWQQDGGFGTYAAINSNEKSVTFDGTNNMRLDSITLDTGAVYPVEIEFDMLQGVDGRQIPNETVNFRQLYFNVTTDTLIDSTITSTIDSSIVSTIDSAFDSTNNVMAYDTIYNTVYDTTYATVYDSTFYKTDSVYSNYSWVVKYQPPCPGVLTVTEISNGPTPAQAGPGQSVPVSGCNYAEILVSGCGTCSSPTVNVQGWILDDNDGSFDINGCTVTAGVTQSHYRLSYDDVWANVPVGSMIVVYNADSNCYNLPDTFTVTPGNGVNGDKASFGNTYWVPLGGTEANPLGKPHMERFKYLLDTSLCNYVVDTITTADTTYDSSYYAVASDWQNTINFDPNGDAFQVRCPRCGGMANEPEFYHGFGYGPDSGSNKFSNIPPDSTSPGGAVAGNTGKGYKYCFMGGGATDLGDPSQWNTYSADSPGTKPSTLGNVNTTYGTKALQGSLGLPCCERTHYHSDDRHNKNGGSNNKNNNGLANQLHKQMAEQSLQNLNVYPIPATMTLNFSYSLQDNVTIKLFDVIGRVMDMQVLQNSSSTSFNVEGYTPGIYMYQVITNTNTQSGKVLIGK